MINFLIIDNAICVALRMIDQISTLVSFDIHVLMFIVLLFGIIFFQNSINTYLK